MYFVFVGTNEIQMTEYHRGALEEHFGYFVDNVQRFRLKSLLKQMKEHHVLTKYQTTLIDNCTETQRCVTELFRILRKKPDSVFKRFLICLEISGLKDIGDRMGTGNKYARNFDKKLFFIIF